MSQTPWMDEARQMVGMSEEKDNAALAKGWIYAGQPHWTSVQGRDHAWCAMFVNWMLHKAGYKTNGRADAVSFKKYGIACEMVPGAIIVIEHEDGSHHVTFLDHVGGDHAIACLGGNQHNKVQVSIYDTREDKVIACRWPSEHA